MQIEPLSRLDQIKQGDALLISDGREVLAATAKLIQISEHDGTEVIFDERRNKFFNVGMYLEGKSWAKDIRVVTMPGKSVLRQGAAEACPQCGEPADSRDWPGLCARHGDEHTADVQAAEAAYSKPPCQECGAMTLEEAAKLCRCGGDKDDCHGSRLWPD